MKLHVLSFNIIPVVFLWVFLLSLAPALCYSAQAVVPHSKSVSTGIQSYREWKNEKIQSTQLKIKSIKESIKQKSSTDPNLISKAVGSEAGLGQELEREVLNLSMIEDLAISDYFVGYLTRQNPLDAAIRDVSGRLTQDEVAELMSAYAQHFFQSKPSTLKAVPRAELNR